MPRAGARRARGRGVPLDARPRRICARFDAYVLPGGFSYQDRVRAGALAAKDPLVESLARGSRAGQAGARDLQRRAGAGRGGTRPAASSTGRAGAGAQPHAAAAAGYHARWVYYADRGVGVRVHARSSNRGRCCRCRWRTAEGRFTSRERGAARQARARRAACRCATRTPMARWPARGSPTIPTAASWRSAASLQRRGQRAGDDAASRAGAGSGGHADRGVGGSVGRTAAGSARRRVTATAWPRPGLTLFARAGRQGRGAEWRDRRGLRPGLDRARDRGSRGGVGAGGGAEPGSVAGRGLAGLRRLRLLELSGARSARGCGSGPAPVRLHAVLQSGTRSADAASGAGGSRAPIAADERGGAASASRRRTASGAPSAGGGTTFGRGIEVREARGLAAGVRGAATTPRPCRRRTGGTAVARTGLLCNPHAQDVRRCAPAHPRCAWLTGPSAEGDAHERSGRGQGTGTRSAGCSRRSGVPRAAEVVALGLHALQHRGQESTGIVSCDDAGRVPRHTRARSRHRRLSTRHDLRALHGVDWRSVTTATPRPAEPDAREHPAAAGRLPRAGRWRSRTTATSSNARELRRGLEDPGSIFQTTLDTEVFLHLMALLERRGSPGGAGRGRRTGARAPTRWWCSPARGCSRCAIRTASARSCIGRLGDGYVVASETCALDLVGADYVRDVQPGRDGARSIRTACARARALPAAEPPLQHCIFEHIYFSRPDSRVFGETVDRVRRRMGHAAGRGASGRGGPRDLGARLQQLDRARLLASARASATSSG